MLEVIANALRSRSARLIEECCGYYRNSKEEWGCYLTVRDAGYYHMISVSHVDDVPKPEAIADALVLPTRYVKEDGRYRNARGTLGLLGDCKERRPLVYGFCLRHPAALSQTVVGRTH